jgi:ABC-type antimicrobial peptide transport system permease subunit
MEVFLKPAFADHDEHGATSKDLNLVDCNPNAAGTFAVLPVQQPAEIVNYKSMGNTPALLGAAFAVGAVVALGLTLTASVRGRRRDLALLKTLGFTRRQLVATVASQATIAALVGVIIGVPSASCSDGGC